MKRFRTLLALLLVFCFVLPLISCGETLPEITTEETETGEVAGDDENEASTPLTLYTTEDLEGKIKYLGERTGTNRSGDVALEWSGSGFAINAVIGPEGSDLRIGLRSNYSSRWQVLVDGEAFGNAVKSANGNRKIIFARGIPSGEHEIRVVKESQTGTNNNNYNNFISLEINGTLLDPPEEKETFLEFIGDGYLVGYGANGKRATSPSINDETSFLASVSYLTSQALDADYSVVAHSGIGLATKAGAYVMDELYDHRFAYRDVDIAYKPTRTPNAIVIHLGMDDPLTSLTKGQFIVQAQEFIEHVRSYYNAKVPVVWLYNTMYHTVRAEEIRALPEVMGAGSEVYALECYYGNSGSGQTKDRYPSAEEHQKTAEILIPFLQEIIEK